MQIEVISVVKLIGTENELIRLRKYVTSPGVGFSFNNVLAPPEELVNMNVDKVLTTQEEINLMSVYGVGYLSDWKMINWGTQFTTVSVSWFSNSYVKLSTVNTPPLGIFHKLTLDFDIKLHVLYTDNHTTGIVFYDKGKGIEKKITGYEAEVVYYLTEDPTFTYKRWIAINKDISKAKKCDMELLFNHDTEYLTLAKSIIDQKSEPIPI